MPVIRASCLLQFDELVTELGGDSEAILAAVGLSPRDAGRFDRFIPLLGAVEAVELAADVTGVPDFGRRLAARRGIETIGAVGLAARSVGTLGEALGIFVRYISAHSPGLRVQLTPTDDGLSSFVGFAIVLDPPPRQRQAVEVLLGAALQIMRALVGDDYAPRSVHLPHTALTSPTSYVRDFGCSARFAQPEAGFTLSQNDFRRRLFPPGSGFHDADEILAALVPGPDPSLPESVTSLVRALLVSGTLSIDTVAAHLHLHPRALQRRLAAEGTTYAALVDKVRRHDAERYLRDTDIDIEHLSEKLGYSEQSVLTRSCHRWFGCAPTAYRRQWRGLE